MRTRPQHLAGKCPRRLKRPIPLKGSIRQVHVGENQHDHYHPQESDDDEQRQRVYFERAHRGEYLRVWAFVGPLEAAFSASNSSMSMSNHMSQEFLTSTSRVHSRRRHTLTWRRLRRISVCESELFRQTRSALATNNPHELVPRKESPSRQRVSDRLCPLLTLYCLLPLYDLANPSRQTDDLWPILFYKALRMGKAIAQTLDLLGSSPCRARCRNAKGLQFRRVR